MADVGPFTVLFGDNVLSRNNLLPRWEKFQISFATLYIVFIVLFGVISPMTLPLCMPTNENGGSIDINDAESQFFAHYCRYQRHDGTDPVTLRFLIVCFVFLAVVASNTVLESSKRSSSVVIFAKSEKIVTSLNMPLQDLKRIAVTPILETINTDHDCPEMKLRKVIKNLIYYDAGDVTIVLMFRGIYTLAILITGFYYTISLYVTVLENGGGPYLYQCTVMNDINLYTNLSDFVCSDTWSQFDFMIVVLYQIVIVMHCSACLIGLIEIVQIRRRVQEQSVCNLSVARKSMLHLVEMNKDSRVKGSTFHKFVYFIFSPETVKIMERFIPTACGFNENVADEEYLRIFGRMTNRNAKYDAWMPALVRKRSWKAIVLLINTLPGHFNDLSFVRNVMDTTDENGNNILYYALHRDPGFLTFTTNAAESILKETELRVVLNQGILYSATEFVKFQYDNDLTYPEQLKDDLLNICKEELCYNNISKV